MLVLILGNTNAMIVKEQKAFSKSYEGQKRFLGLPRATSRSQKSVNVVHE